MVAKEDIKRIDMEVKKVDVWTLAAASSPGAIVLASKVQHDDDTEPDKEEGSLGTFLDASPFCMKTSLLGVA